MSRPLTSCVCLAGLVAFASDVSAQPLHLDPDPDPAGSSRPINQSRIGYTDISISSAVSAGDEVLIEPSFGLGVLTPQVDGGLLFGFASTPLVSGKRRAFWLTPTVGRHIGWERGRKEVYQLYGSAQLPIQWRYGAGLGRETGYAVAAEVGGRMWACAVRGSVRGTCAGLTVGIRYRHHLSEFQMDSAVLPAGSSVLTVPVSVSFAMRLD